MSLEEKLLQQVRGRFDVPKELRPNSILIFGDVHGYTSTYQKFIRRLPPGQRTIQIGDMALGFEGVGLHRMPDEHKFFRGNHDCPQECRAHPNYLGDYGYIPETGIFYLAGAWSIDRAMRVEDQSWWRDEELSYEELDRAVELYRQTKPRFVLSHEAPAKVSGVLLAHIMGPYFAAKGECSKSRTAQALQIMLEDHAPKEWVFGHYHVDKQFYTPGFNTKFTCVGGQMELGDAPHTYWLDLD